jgi:hypothetical protein
VTGSVLKRNSPVSTDCCLRQTQRKGQRYRLKQSFRARDAYQSSGLWVVDHVGDRPIPNVPNRFVNHMERHQEPFPRLDGMSEAVFDGQVELRGAKQAVEDGWIQLPSAPVRALWTTS